MMRRIIVAAALAWATLALVAAFAWLRHPVQPSASSTTPTVVVLNGSGTNSGQIAAVSQTTSHATTRTS